MIDKDLYIAFLESTIKKQTQLPKDELRTHRRTRRKQHKWSTAQKLELMNLHNSGWTASQIAQKMGLRTTQVYNMIYCLVARNQVTA